MLNDAGTKKTMERKTFLYRNGKLLNCSITNQNYFGSGKVYFYLTGTYMNDPEPKCFCESCDITSSSQIPEERSDLMANGAWRTPNTYQPIPCSYSNFLSPLCRKPNTKYRLGVTTLDRCYRKNCRRNDPGLFSRANGPTK